MSAICPPHFAAVMLMRPSQFDFVVKKPARRASTLTHSSSRTSARRFSISSVFVEADSAGWSSRTPACLRRERDLPGWVAVGHRLVELAPLRGRGTAGRGRGPPAPRGPGAARAARARRRPARPRHHLAHRGRPPCCWSSRTPPLRRSPADRSTPACDGGWSSTGDRLGGAVTSRSPEGARSVRPWPSTTAQALRLSHSRLGGTMSKPTLSYAGLTSALLLTAYVVSAAFQLYRASLGTGLQVDRFGADAAVAYLVFLAVAVAARSRRRLVAYAVAVIVTANPAYGVVGYYPALHAAPPMDPRDWLAGTGF